MTTAAFLPRRALTRSALPPQDEQHRPRSRHDDVMSSAVRAAVESTFAKRPAAVAVCSGPFLGFGCFFVAMMNPLRIRSHVRLDADVPARAATVKQRMGPVLVVLGCSAGKPAPSNCGKSSIASFALRPRPDLRLALGSIDLEVSNRPRPEQLGKLRLPKPWATSSPGTVRAHWHTQRDVAVPTALGCAGRGYEPFLYDPNPTFSAIRRTVELVGKGNPLERGLIEDVITGRSPSDAGARTRFSGGALRAERSQCHRWSDEVSGRR